MRTTFSLVLALFLALPGCEGSPEALGRGVIEDAVEQTLETGSATVEGEFVLDELEGRDTEVLAMKGQVDFDEGTQALAFTDRRAQPGEAAEVYHLVSSANEYFVDDTPAGVSNRLALFDGLTYEEGLEKGTAPVIVTIDDEGMIREVRVAIPYYDSQSGELANHQTYTVRFDAFGEPVSIETPPEDSTADFDPDLYIKGLTPSSQGSTNE